MGIKKKKGEVRVGKGKERWAGGGALWEDRKSNKNERRKKEIT